MRNILLNKVSSYISCMPEKKFCLCFFFLVSLYYLILSIQGFDMCDEGWVLTGYQEIFNCPSSVEYLFLYYFSQLVGGIWNMIFGWMGIFGFRLLAVITIITTFIILYNLFKGIISRPAFVLGVIVVSLCYPFGIFAFHHNYLSVLLSSLCIFLLYKGLVNLSNILFLGGGVVLGVDFFVRLPNVALLAFYIVLFVYGKKNSFRAALRNALVLSLGIIIGVLMILVIMLSLNHFDLFVGSIKMGFSAADSAASTHNFGYMLGVYLNNYVLVAGATLLLWFIPIVFYFAVKKGWINIKSKLWIISIVILYLLCCVFLFAKVTVNVFIVYAFCTPLLIYGYIYYKDNSSIQLLSVMCFLLLYAQPLGSDFGISNMGRNSLWPSVFMSLALLYNFSNKVLYKYSFKLLYIPLAIFIMLGTKNIMSQCYFDAGWRWNKLYKIDTKLATTLTKKENKQAIEPLLKKLPNYIKEDEYVLFFQHTPMLHFLTKTRPYLRNPWPWSLDPANMEQQFAIAENSISYLPVVVRDKGDVPYWQVYNSDWDNMHAVESYYHKNRRIELINKFLIKNDYEIVWDNELFQILKPREKK